MESTVGRRFVGGPSKPRARKWPWLSALLAALLLMTTSAQAALACVAPEDTKIEFCHATGSESNPYNLISTNVRAFLNAGHIDHSKDIWAAFDYLGPKGERIDVAAQGDQSILRNGCEVPKPPKPGPKTVNQTAEGCELKAYGFTGKSGVVKREGEQEYIWSGSEWVLEAESGIDWGNWKLVKEYSNDEYFQKCAPKPDKPAVTATCLACAHQGQADGAIKVTVTNTADKTKATVEYTVTVGGVDKKVTVKDGESGDVEFNGLAAGDYTVKVKGDDKTSAETSVTVKDCPKPPKPAGEIDLTKSCEVIQLNAPKGVKPEGAEYAYKIDGNSATIGVQIPLTPGEHIVTLWVNGEKVDWQKVVIEKCPVVIPPAGESSFSYACESLTVNAPKGVKPEDAKYVYKLDGSPIEVGEHSITSGEHTLTLWVNGEKVDTDTFVIEKCVVPPVEKVATAPTSQDKCEPKEGTDDSVTIPADEFFTYKLDGVDKAAGTYPVMGTSATVTAHAKDGFTPKPDSKTSWTFEFTKKACVVPPTPVAPTQPTKVDKCEPASGTTNDRLIIPTDNNFGYLIDGESVNPGTYTAEDEQYVVTAVPKEGVVVQEGTQTEWTFEFTKKACSSEYNPPTSQGPGADDGLDPFTAAGVITTLAAGLVLAVRRRFVKQ